MRIIFICLLLGGCLDMAVAQRANYKLAEQAKSDFSRARFERVVPFFVPGSDNFWYKMDTDDGEKFYFVDVKAKKVEELFDREHLAREMAEVTGRTYDAKKLGFWGNPFEKDGITLKWRDGDIEFAYNRVTKKLSHAKFDPSRQPEYMNEMSQEEQQRMFRDQSLSPDGRYKVFGKRCNAYLRDLKDSTETQLTFDGEPGFAYADERGGDTEVMLVPVWFDDSKHFFLFRHDSRNIGEVFSMNYLKGRPSAHGSQTVLAGDSVLLRTEISIVDVDSKQQKKVKIEKWQDQACRVLHTDKKLNKMYMERKTRRSNVLEVCEVDLTTGNVKVLIHEEGDPYIGVELASIHFLNDCKDIIWWSERSGFGHFYHYDGNGNLKNVITSGAWTAGQVMRIDEKNREIYFQAYGIVPGENPSYAKICKANIDGKGKVVMLTPEEATHDVQFSPSGKYFIDTYSRPDLPFQYVLRDTRGRLIAKLGEADIISRQKKGWKAPELFSVKAADGTTDLYGVMWKPFDFDSTKKYPIISCVYPGPQTDNVPLSFEVGSANELLAQVGFVVVAFNHRGGLPYRGRAYHSFGYDNIRDHALADDKSGLEQLIGRYSFVDGDRVGVYGHSGGGMMSTAAICTYPDFYKACVSSAGNHDNNIYSQFFVEGHYKINEEVKTVRENVKTADRRDSVITREKTVYSTDLPTNMELARNLKGHLMLVVGGYDGNVHPANTIRMVDAFVNHGKDIEFVFLPRARHSYDGAADWYFQHKLWSHFAKYLLGDFTTPCFHDIEVDEYGRIVKE